MTLSIILCVCFAVSQMILSCHNNLYVYCMLWFYVDISEHKTLARCGLSIMLMARSCHSTKCCPLGARRCYEVESTSLTLMRSRNNVVCHCNFHSLEVVSRWRDPQLQVSENYWAHDVVTMSNQRQWRWFNVATTSCVQWLGSCILPTYGVCCVICLTPSWWLRSPDFRLRWWVGGLCGGHHHYRRYDGFDRRLGHGFRLPRRLEELGRSHHLRGDGNQRTRLVCRGVYHPLPISGDWRESDIGI